MKRLATAALIAGGMLAASVEKAGAATIFGADYGGANLNVNDGDILSGTFTNVGLLTIGAGTTAYVAQGVALSISAESILINGNLNGVGTGSSGGAAVPSTDGASGLSGSGLGGGAGGAYGDAIHGSGGGGGAYGGDGGSSGQSLDTPLFASGGTAYGTENPPDILMGSGGGSAASHCSGCGGVGGAGGAGGGAVSLSTTGRLVINGSIVMDGQNGFQGSSTSNASTSGGGGGSGGGINLTGLLTLNGLLSASGGDGANFSVGLIAGCCGQGGGGGGGGRVKLSGVAIALLSGFSINVSGGYGGHSDATTIINATDGRNGTFVDKTIAPVPIPAALPLLISALGFFGFLGWRQKKAVAA